MAGYSGTPLIRKLGIRSHSRILFRNPPEGYLLSLGDMPENVTILRRLAGSLDFIHAFFSKRRDLERDVTALISALKKDGMLWLSWPKEASGVATDVTETVVRETGLTCGLVDVKICAVDNTWSGLKFVYRKSDR